MRVDYNFHAIKWQRLLNQPVTPEEYQLLKLGLPNALEHLTMQRAIAMQGLENPYKFKLKPFLIKAGACLSFIGLTALFNHWKRDVLGIICMFLAFGVGMSIIFQPYMWHSSDAATRKSNIDYDEKAKNYLKAHVDLVTRSTSYDEYVSFTKSLPPDQVHGLLFP